MSSRIRYVSMKNQMSGKRKIILKKKHENKCNKIAKTSTIDFLGYRLAFSGDVKQMS